MPISNEMKVRVAHANVSMGMSFMRSLAHWQQTDNWNDQEWKSYSPECNALLIGKKDAIVIDGNCTNTVSALEGGTIHIYGNLKSKLEIAEHSEVVISGDVNSDAEIHASGICHVFVGGKFSGKYFSSGSDTIWISSRFDGVIQTGKPSTHLYIGEDFRGEIRPREYAALLFLTVDGFAPQKSIEKIIDLEYTQFCASVAQSDLPPGIYPPNGHHKRQSGGHSYNRWCVRSSAKMNGE